MPSVSFQLNGEEFTTESEDAEGNKLNLMDVLRSARLTSVKDGCAPQGQCGCCTVLVDGKARVSCVTPVSRVRGRTVETLEGLPTEAVEAWAGALAGCGGTQCGFCTPGIVMRFEARHRDPRSPITRSRGAGNPPDDGEDSRERMVQVASDAESALRAHLCRCTGWNGVIEAAVQLSTGRPSEMVTAGADERATLESGTHQAWFPSVPLGFGAFAVDTVAEGSLVAMRGGEGSWVVGGSQHEARVLSGKVQGRRTTSSSGPPIDVPQGDWGATLQTSWVEPAYLETDASHCEPGGEPSGVLANGGAFGAKLDSPLPEEARRLADEHGRAVLAVWSREDSIRLGSKRPPMAIGMGTDGTGTARVASGADNDRIREAVLAAAPGLGVEFVQVTGPPTSANHRCAGWLEALAVSMAAGVESPLGSRKDDWFRVVQPGGGWAKVRIAPVNGPVDLSGNRASGNASGNGASGNASGNRASGGSAAGDSTPQRSRIDVVLGAGEPLSEVVLRSFATGAVHMAIGLVSSESITVEPDGVKDLTIRSLGILGANDMPEVSVELDPDSSGPGVPVADAVFAAAACAVWSHHEWAPIWPTLRHPPI